MNFFLLRKEEASNNKQKQQLSEKQKPSELRKMSIHAKLLQSCPNLCGPMDYNQPGSPVRGILQARILAWVTISSSRGSALPGDLPNHGIRPTSPASPALAGRFLTTSSTRKAPRGKVCVCVCVRARVRTHARACISTHLVVQSCPILCDPLDYSPPGYSVHRISQAKTLQWVAISLYHLKILCGLTGLGQEIGIQVTEGTNVNWLISSLFYSEIQTGCFRVYTRSAS